MVGRDTVTFKFRLDAKEMQRLIKALEADASRFGAKMTKVGNDAQNAGRKIGQSGDNAAAAAVNFQTATQGIMNLGTAAAQTFTSVSNLDRAANRLAQANLGVARATDLMNNKELRLDELRQNGMANSKKAALLTNEIATARADLAVKTDKARIEEGALLDIQILFATNIANVMVSSIQTIKSMRDMQALSAIRAGIAESGLIVKMKSLIFAQRAVSLNAIGTTTAFKGMTLGIKGMTLSVRGLMIALGPVALIIGGVSLAMQAYEENWGGFKDSMQSALPFLKETNSDLDEAQRILEEDRIAMEGYTGAIDGLSGSLKDLSIPHRNYLEMMANAAINLGGNIELAKQYTKQLGEVKQAQIATGFSQPSFAGGQVGTGQVGTGFVGPSTSSSSTASGVSSAVSHQPTSSIPQDTKLPTALDTASQSVDVAASYNDWYANHASKGISWSQYQSQHKPIKDISNLKFTPSLGASAYTFTGTSFNVAPHPFGTPQQKNAFNFLPKKERETMALQLLGQYQSSDDPAEQLLAFQARDLYDSIKNEKSQDIKGGAEAWKEIINKNPTGFGDVDNRFLSGTEFIKSFKKYTQQEGPNQYRIDLDTPDMLGRTQRASFTANVNRLRKIVAEETLKDKLEQVKKGLISDFGMSKGREVAYGGSGGVEILKAVLGNDNLQNRPDTLLDGMVKGMLSNIDLFSSGTVETERLNIMGNYITRSGRVGEGSIIDKLRDLQVQSLLANDPNAFTKTSTNLGKHTMAQFKGMYAESNVSNMSRFRGQVSPSETIEILKRNAKTLRDNAIMRAIRQDNNVRLQFGGTLIPGMTKDDPNAVVGGFTSKQEFLAFGRQESARKFGADVGYIQQFGINPLHNISGGGARGAIRRMKPILANQSQNYRSILESSGLSLKGVPSYGYNPYWEPANARRIYREHVIAREKVYAFNQSQLSRAREINVLLGYDQQQFFGSDLQLPALSDAINAQDALMKTIGLDRTEAFQIIDTQGRGREEIDDRLRFKDRLSSMSTGTSVL